MPRILVDIRGEKEVIQELKKLEDNGKSKLLDAAVAGCEFLKPKIQDAIPINNEDDRHLRDNIKVVKGRRKKSTNQSANIEVGKRSVDYGFHLEAGTQHMEGRKFMRNTADKYAEEVANIVTKKFLDSLGV